MSDIMLHYLDGLRKDLKDLHPDDRLEAAARMLGRPQLAKLSSFQRLFNRWRKENNL